MSNKEPMTYVFILAGIDTYEARPGDILRRYNDFQTKAFANHPDSKIAFQLKTVEQVNGLAALLLNLLNKDLAVIFNHFGGLIYDTFLPKLKEMASKGSNARFLLNFQTVALNCARKDGSYGIPWVDINNFNGPCVEEYNWINLISEIFSKTELMDAATARDTDWGLILEFGPSTAKKILTSTVGLPKGKFFTLGSLTHRNYDPRSNFSLNFVRQHLKEGGSIVFTDTEYLGLMKDFFGDDLKPLDSSENNDQ